MHDSERGSVIYDCLVMMCVIASEGLSSMIAMNMKQIDFLEVMMCIIASEGLSSMIALL